MGTRAGCLEMSMKDEATLDLFTEQAFGPAFGRVMTTAINADASRTCEIDANNDGGVNSSVKTHITKSILRMPATVVESTREE